MSTYTKTYNSLFEYTIDQEWIDRREKRAKLFNPNGRTWEDQLKNADCELLEYVLCKLGIHTDANRMQFDTFDEASLRTEFKCMSEAGTVTLKDWTLKQSFDMYLFFKFQTSHTRPFELGENVVMQIVERGTKREIEKRSTKSNFKNGGRYIFPKYNKNKDVQYA